jgi:hypothetical protein
MKTKTLGQVAYETWFHANTIEDKVIFDRVAIAVIRAYEQMGPCASCAFEDHIEGKANLCHNPDGCRWTYESNFKPRRKQKAEREKT